MDWKEWGNHVLLELERLARGQETLAERLTEQNETLVRNTLSLEEHIKRTNLLEEDMRAVKAHVNRAEGFLAALSWVFSSKNLLGKLLIIALIAAVSYLGKGYL